MRQALNPILDENDGTFWMSFEDFVSHFTAFNVCRVNNWEEHRLKGLFEKIEV